MPVWVDELPTLRANTTKSLVQSGVSLTLKVNLAGYIPSATLAPEAPRDTLQSTLERFRARIRGSGGNGGSWRTPLGMRGAPRWRLNTSAYAAPWRLSCCSQ